MPTAASVEASVGTALKSGSSLNQDTVVIFFRFTHEVDDVFYLRAHGNLIMNTHQRIENTCISVINQAISRGYVLLNFLREIVFGQHNAVDVIIMRGVTRYDDVRRNILVETATASDLPGGRIIAHLARVKISRPPPILTANYIRNK